MEAMLVRERYKVVRVLSTEEHYALWEAVDIQDRETPRRLLNVYEGPLLRRYAGVLDRMGARPGYHGMFLAEERLVAVFDDCQGRTIGQVFYRGDHWDWKSRLAFAHALMQYALNLADLPPEVGCSALQPENLLADAAETRFRTRSQISPMAEPDGRTLPLLAAARLRSILRPRFSSAGAELDLLERLERPPVSGIVPAYALWLEAREDIRAEHEALDEKNALLRGWTLLVKSGRRRWKRRPRQG